MGEVRLKLGSLRGALRGESEEGRQCGCG